MTIEYDNEQNKTVVADDLSVSVFLGSLNIGYTTSFSSNQLPLVILDKGLSGKVPAGRSVITVKRNEWEITYKAAAIANKKTGEISHAFATSSAMLILDSIWDLVTLGKCHLKQSGDVFRVMFRKQVLREYLSEKKKSRSGKQINDQLEILQSSILEVRNTKVDGHSSSVKLSGAYLQNAFEIDSDDPAIDGFYVATIHPVIARDLILGRFRDVETKYLSDIPEGYELYKALIHIMRHEFTNADAKSQCISFDLWFGDIMFSAGKVDPTSQGTMRKSIGILRKELISKGVISDKKGFKSTWQLDAERGVNDFRLTITPTVTWGVSQRKSNAKFKKQLDVLTSSYKFSTSGATAGIQNIK